VGEKGKVKRGGKEYHYIEDKSPGNQIARKAPPDSKAKGGRCDLFFKKHHRNEEARNQGNVLASSKGGGPDKQDEDIEIKIGGGRLKLIQKSNQKKKWPEKPRAPVWRTSVHGVTGKCTKKNFQLRRAGGSKSKNASRLGGEKTGQWKRTTVW